MARLDAVLLAVEGATSRQRLLQLQWPDDEPENARNVLRQRLFRLRRAVGADVVAGAELLSLAPDACRVERPSHNGAVTAAV